MRVQVALPVIIDENDDGQQCHAKCPYLDSEIITEHKHGDCTLFNRGLTPFTDSRGRTHWWLCDKCSTAVNTLEL